MLSSNGHPYLRAEYLNPPPSTLDSKKSPLALLAQTCSQIGSDPSSSASAAPKSSSTTPQAGATSERKKSVSDRDKSSPLSVGGGASDSAMASRNTDAKPSSKKSSESRLTPSSDRRSKSTSPKSRNASGPSEAPPTATSAAPSTMMNHSGGAQQQHPLGDPSSAAALSLAGYKSLMAAGMGSPYSASPFNPYGPAHGAYPPGAQQAALDLGAYASALNAFNSAKSAAMAMPPPPASIAAMMSGYLGAAGAHPASAAYSAALAYQYSRLKNPAMDMNSSPCRDPYCTGCPANNNNPTPSNGFHMVCTAGCSLTSQCDHPRVPIPAHLATNGMFPGPPMASSVSPVGQSGNGSSPHSAAKPYVCNWIVGDNYCGKRFPSSDDLLQHLRTHTNLSSAAGSAAAAASNTELIATSVASSMHPSAAVFSHPSLRAYPTPPLSPHSAARYHPYGKNPGPPQPPTSAASAMSMPPQQPGGFPAGMFHPQHQQALAAAMAGAPTGYPASFFSHPALAPYYSHLSLFGPRGLGSASLPP